MSFPQSPILARQKEGNLPFSRIVQTQPTAKISDIANTRKPMTRKGKIQPYTLSQISLEFSPISPCLLIRTQVLEINGASFHRQGRLKDLWANVGNVDQAVLLHARLAASFSTGRRSQDKPDRQKSSKRPLSSDCTDSQEEGQKPLYKVFVSILMFSYIKERGVLAIQSRSTHPMPTGTVIRPKTFWVTALQHLAV